MRSALAATGCAACLSCATPPPLDESNAAQRSSQIRIRDAQVAQLLQQAESLRVAGDLDSAAALYSRVVEQDPANPRARAGFLALERDRRHQVLLAEAERLAKEQRHREAADRVQLVLAENPGSRDAQRFQRLIEDQSARQELMPVRLRAQFAKPMSFDLRDVTVRSVLDIVARQTGVSFVYDKDARPDARTSIAVRNASAEELISLVLSTNQLEQKVVNETTVLVYPKTQQKMREYQELVIRTFYLANADVRQTASMIRTLLRTREIFFDEKIGMLAIRDRPEVIRQAERLIAAQDLAEPEVMLEVEVLEVARNRLQELGVRFPSSVALSLVGGGTATPAPGGGIAVTGGTPGVLSLPEWLNRNSSLVRLSFTDPLFILNLRQEDGGSSVLANPRIRVRNKERARVHIGDRVPVITTTAAAAGGFVSESVTYLDVGLKLDVEPLISLDDEVGIKVGLEVSNIAREVRSATSNTLTYQIGTRNASTVLRLRDGETQVLAGLINDEERRSAARVPGLGELPVLGRLFSSTSETSTKTEIVLLITPRLMRTLARPGARVLEFSAGTDAALAAGGSAPPPPLPQPEPQKPPPATTAPTVPQAPGSPVAPFGGVQPSPR